MANGGLTLSEESLRRLVPPQAARNVFLRQTQEDPQAIQARAEGTLRAEAAVRSTRFLQTQRIQIERERIAESKRQFEIDLQVARRERKRDEPSFIQTLFGK